MVTNTPHRNDHRNERARVVFSYIFDVVQTASGACQIVIVASYSDPGDGTRCLLNVAILMADAGRRVVCTSLAANAYGFDRLAFEGDDAAVAVLRGDKLGLYDLLAEYQDTLLRAPSEAAGARKSDAGESIRVGPLKLRRPSTCLVEPRIATTRHLPVSVLRGGPSISDWRKGTGGRSAFRDDEAATLYFELLTSDFDADVLLIDCPEPRRLESTIERLAGAAVDTLVVLTRYTDDDMSPAYHSLARIMGTDGQPPPSHIPAVLVVGSGVEQHRIEPRARGTRVLYVPFHQVPSSGGTRRFSPPK